MCIRDRLPIFKRDLSDFKRDLSEIIGQEATIYIEESDPQLSLIHI